MQPAAVTGDTKGPAKSVVVTVWFGRKYRVAICINVAPVAVTGDTKELAKFVREWALSWVKALELNAEPVAVMDDTKGPARIVMGTVVFTQVQ